MNIALHVFWQIFLCLLQDLCFQVELLGQRICICSALVDTKKLFSKVVITICSPIAMYKNSQLSQNLVIPGIFSCPHFSHSDRWTLWFSLNFKARVFFIFPRNMLCQSGAASIFPRRVDQQTHFRKNIFPRIVIAELRHAVLSQLQGNINQGRKQIIVLYLGFRKKQLGITFFQCCTRIEKKYDSLNLLVTN